MYVSLPFFDDTVGRCLMTHLLSESDLCHGEKMTPQISLDHSYSEVVNRYFGITEEQAKQLRLD